MEALHTAAMATSESWEHFDPPFILQQRKPLNAGEIFPAIRLSEECHEDSTV